MVPLPAAQRGARTVETSSRDPAVETEDTRMSKSDQPSRYRLRVNSYDRASSLLVSLLIVASVTVAGLLIVYFARRLIVTQRAVPVTPVDAAGRPADAAMGLKRDIEPPGI